MGTLDLSKVDYTAFSAAGNSWILGQIFGTDGSALAEDGSTGLPLNGGTDLRTASGQKIFYDTGANPSLNGKTYLLSNLDATGSGGVLTPITASVPEPATLGLLVMGRLALAGSALRRRMRR